MRKLLVLLLISLFAINARATEPDKKLHFWYSGAISTAVYAGLRQHGHGRAFSYSAGVSTALFLGTLKELTDKNFDRHDMEYNAMGALAVPVVFLTF